MQKAFGKYMNLVIAAMITVVAMVAFSACQKDEPGNEEVEPGIPSPVSISIVETIVDKSTPENELINDYWVVFVNASGKIVDIVDRPLTNDGPVQAETFKTKLPSGYYSIYAFANISKTENGEYEICDIKLKVGDIIPEDFESKVYSEPVTADASVVPMTGFEKKVKIDAVESNNIVIEVVRLVAKFNFRFYSDADQDITVDSIAINCARTKYIPLFPDYAKLDDHTAPIIPEGAQSGWFVKSLKKNPALVPAKTPETNSVNRHFYVFESSAGGHETEHYILHFYVKDSNGKSHRLEAMLLDDDQKRKDYIYRNDLLDIPVLFTNWNVNLDIRFYPPIGGYPTVVVKSEGDQFNAEFGSSGLFVIKPKVTDYNGKQYGYKEYTCDVSIEEDPNGILAYIAEGLDNAAELVGEINIGKTGTAILNLEFRVKIDQLEHIFVRKLYIKR